MIVKQTELFDEKKKIPGTGSRIRANTRFAPTKDFRVNVGVNLVFTRYFETACKICPYDGTKKGTGANVVIFPQGHKGGE
jgi:hypothetical protein